MPTTAEAQNLLASLSNIRFYQRFEIVPGVFTPSGVDSELMLEAAQVPHDMKGKTVLDVGCFNGAVGFLCERRGASRVVCIDVNPDPQTLGITQIRDFLGSKIEYSCCNLYDITLNQLGKFDYVICFGVLYHLRHLLLGIDMLYQATRETCFIETAFCDNLVPSEVKDQNVIFFDYPHFYNPADHSNWFLPTLRAYAHILENCGFRAELCKIWGDEKGELVQGKPHRCTFKCTPLSAPKWIELGSYEGLYPAERFRVLVRGHL